jgi:hypothetical protein
LHTLTASIWPTSTATLSHKLSLSCCTLSLFFCSFPRFDIIALVTVLNANFM